VSDAQVGFSQRLRLEWLDAAAFMFRDGKSPQEIDAALLDLLSDRVSVGTTAVRGTIHKAVTILLKIWVTIPPDLTPLRDDAIAFLDTLPAGDRLTLHWGLSMAAYPFFAAVAAHVGRLLRLQGSTAYPQILRRVCEQYGQRDTVTRAARRIIRTLVDWGALADSEEPGIYVAAPLRKVHDAALVAWLTEATLRASGSRSAGLAVLYSHPALFPFEVKAAPQAALARSPRLEVFRQSLDEEVVALR
jgi:hypothetical protein